MKDTVRDPGGVMEGESETSAQAMRVLITDDSAAMRCIVRDKLGKLSDDATPLRIDEAETGEQALRLASANPYDVIFLDVEMPGINGLETCRRVKELTAARVVILSSLGAGSDHHAGREAGCDNYLTKPPNDSDLKVILRLVSIRMLTAM